MANFHITLVHGTFARNARWTRKGSDFRTALRQHLENNGHHVEFTDPLAWTGANRVFARRNAAKALATKLLGHTDDHADVVHVTIGHSHGGSAVVYALKAAPRLAQALDGVVFLATPFIDVRAHLDWRLAARLLALLFFAAMWSTAFVATFFWISEYVSGVGDDWVVWAALVVFAVVGLAGWRLETCVTARIAEFLEQRIARFISDVSTSDLPDAPAYFLARAPADEAAAMLTFIQFIAWLTSQVSYAIASAAHTVTYGMQRIWRFGWLGKLLLAAMIAVLVFGFLGASVGVYVAAFDRDLANFDELPLLDLVFFSATNPGIDTWWVRLPVVAALLASTALVVAAAGMFLATVVSVITHVAFGTAWTAGPFVQLAVEPVPRGRWTLHRTDWPERSGLAHSSPYASPQAVQALAGWIAALDARSVSKSNVHAG